VQKEAVESYFWKNKILDPSEISGGNKFETKILNIWADFVPFFGMSEVWR